jgi:hypothetical protein
VTAQQKLDEIKNELEAAGQTLPGVLRALGPGISFQELLKVKMASDIVQAVLAEAYEAKMPKRMGKVETRGCEHGRSLSLSELDR